MAEEVKQEAEVTPEEELEVVEEYGALDYIQDSITDLLATADVTAAYGEPIEHEGRLIIPTAEVVAVLGMGAGKGGGGGEEGGYGDGGGAGGTAHTRPVAVIISDKDGVRMEPVMDVTKVALAFITAIGFMVGMVMRMRRMPRHHR